MAKIRPKPGKTIEEVRQEWDEIAPLRFQQITGGRDPSYSHVLEPAVMDLVAECDCSSVLDVGCGVGILTGRLGDVSGQVTGIDMSRESIGLARRHNCNRSNVELLEALIDVFAPVRRHAFTLVVANMVLMTVLDLQSTLGAISTMLKPDGRLVFTITHPWFWPAYWGYDEESWFSYMSEIVIEAPFVTSLDNTAPFVTTHIHRPLELYFESLTEAGLMIESLTEPQPRPPVVEEYLSTWRVPRFLAMRCSRGVLQSSK